MILKNILRRKTRTALTVLGISVGVAAVVALGAIAEGFTAQFTAVLTKGGADLTIVQDKVADTSLSVVDEEVGERIAAMPGVAHVSGMLFSVVPAPGTPYFMVFGYDPHQYAIRNFKIVQGKTLTGDRQLILGNTAAGYMKKKVGETLKLQDIPYRIVGIYQTGVGYEDGGAVITLKDAQRMFKKPRQVGFYQIKVKDRDRIDQIQNDIARRFKGIKVSRSGDFAENTQDVQVTRSFAWAIALLAVFVGGIGMTNALLMAVFERTREIGVLRALGWRRWRILWMIMQESLLLSFFGGCTGIVLGVVLVQAIQALPFGASLLQAYFSPELFVQALVVALSLGTIGGLYPAWRASQLSPLEALRYE